MTNKFFTTSSDVDGLLLFTHLVMRDCYWAEVRGERRFPFEEKLAVSIEMVQF